MKDNEMKKKLILLFFLIVITGFVFAQKIPVLGIMTFEAGSGVSTVEALEMTNKVLNEFNSWGTISAVFGAGGADYVIRATLSRQTGGFVLSALTVNTNNEQIVNTYREQANAVNSISVFSFCIKAVEGVPFPNYMIGTWQSTLNMPDGPVVCVIEFRSDRTVRVERYDTWEHRRNNALRYEGFGKGTYSYVGYANRVININSQSVRVDAAINVNLSLEETLPDQTSVNQTGLTLVFNADKTTFNFVNGMLPCGTNHDGPSVYPSVSLGFVNFIKIR